MDEQRDDKASTAAGGEPLSLRLIREGHAVQADLVQALEPLYGMIEDLWLDSAAPLLIDESELRLGVAHLGGAISLAYREEHTYKIDAALGSADKIKRASSQPWVMREAVARLAYARDNAGRLSELFHGELERVHRRFPVVDYEGIWELVDGLLKRLGRIGQVPAKAATVTRVTRLRGGGA